jgi:hypothetical protein
MPLLPIDTFEIIGISSTSSSQVDWCLGHPKPAIPEQRQWLRVVRHLPVRADLSEPDEAWGQVLDKPPGRKPRERADAGTQDR